MKVIRAYKTAHAHCYDIWADETKTLQTDGDIEHAIQIGTVVLDIPVTDADGEPAVEKRTFKVYADPAFVYHFEWGNDVSVDTAMAEMKPLVAEGLRAPEAQIEYTDPATFDIEKTKVVERGVAAARLDKRA